MSNEMPEIKTTALANVSPALPAILPATLPANVETEIAKLIPMAGTLELTQKQKDILYAPVDESLVEIRPDGLIYLPWMEYAKRLRDALGGRWALIPTGEPKIRGDLVVRPYYLVIDGKPMGEAWGEQKYSPTNSKMTWGDAIEGARSNALMRLCKGLGMTLDMWQPTFIKTWVAKYAESYWDKDKQGNSKEFWRKKGNPSPSPAPPKGAKPTAPPPPPPPPDDFLEGEELGDAEEEKQAKKVFVTLTLTDGKVKNVDLSTAYKYFGKMKAGLTSEIYEGILKLFGYKHKSEVRPYSKLTQIYKEMVEKYKELDAGRA